ncbi:MAG: NADH-quinone oxidoreductase subunit NuoE [Armatimonadota bacterium]
MACNCGLENKFCELDDYIKDIYDPEHPQSALITILHHAQNKYGYLSDELMEYIAQATHIPAAEIYGVATFYGYFRLEPQGKYQISVCIGTACYIRGANAIMEKLEQELGIVAGETTDDGLFTLNGTRCIGACGLAPVIMIDEKVYGRVEPSQIPDILDEYRNKKD